jgi:neutral ceramidase
VGLCNHTDTVGGDKISSDWHHFIEEEVSRQAGYPVTVISLLGASGNINHVDVTNNDPHTGYEVAEQIGRDYGKCVTTALAGKCDAIAPGLEVRQAAWQFKKRKIPTADLEKARKILSQPVAASGTLTSEDLAKGSGAVARFFAQQLVEFAEKQDGQSVPIPFKTLVLGDELAIVTLPGEPFTEIGLAIKQGSRFKRTVVLGYSNGDCGYIPLRECFARGGYEVLPVANGGASEDMAETMTAVALKTVAE